MHLIPTEMTGGELRTQDMGSMVLPNFGTNTLPCFDDELSPLAVIMRMGLLE